MYSVTGKIIDISEEEKEKEILIAKSQLDGLTGLYNATRTKDLICKSIINKGKKQIDALIIIDCDKFKDINDIFGHLKGDLVLESVGIAILKEKSTDEKLFNQADDAMYIAKKNGGARFIVYDENINP